MPLPRWPTRQVDGLREYAWLDDTPLAMATGAVASPAWSYIHTGNLGEPVMLTNAAGAMTTSVTRDPWGNPILIAGTNPLALGYPGQWKDLAGGLWHNHNRDYDPSLGRYTEADPIGLAGGANLYGYVGGNPVNWVDPQGLKEYNLFPFEEPLMQQAADREYQSLPRDVRDGWNHIFGHASANVFCVHAKSGPTCLNPQQFVRWLQDNHVNPNMPIKLWGCSTAAGENSFAQRLSELLGGRTVVAATNKTLWNWSDGFVGIKNDGHWVRYGRGQ